MNYILFLIREYERCLQENKQISLQSGHKDCYKGMIIRHKFP